MSALTPSASAIAPVVAAPPVTVIRPRRRLTLLDLPGIWRYRDLLWLMAKRDVQVRYKQTLLGALWAVLQPFGMMVVIAVCLGPITGVRDPITLYAGLLPWTLFSAGLAAAGNSLLTNSNLLKKVYFPRIILPLAALGAPVLDFGIGFGVFIGLMIWFATPFSPALALLPLFTLTTLTAALGLGFVTSAISATYRDFRFVLPFALQVLFFATPIVVTHEQFPAWLAPALWLNPVSGTIGGFRSAVLGQPIDWAGWAVSSAVSVACLLAGLWYFSRTERRFADVI